jgi:DNA-binding YbaB/EbfC family protein
MTDGFDLGGLLEQAQAMQQQMMEAQAQQATQVITGTAGGNKVAIEMTGTGEFKRVTIAPDAVDPDDVELLEELILAALRDGAAQIAELQEQSMGGMDLGALGGMLGGE